MAMKKPFKFRYVNEIVGGFVLIVVALVVVGIYVAGRAQGWFEPVYKVRVVFPAEGSFGLRKGSEVRVLDTPAGTVEDIVPDEEGRMEGIFRVRGRFFPYLREDSKAIVRLTLAVAGDAYVELTRGQGEPLPTVGAVMPISKDTEILELAENLLEEVRATTVPAIEQLRLALEEYTGLASDLRDPDGSVQQMILELRATIDHVNRILADVAESTQSLPNMVRRVEGELDDMPGLVYQTQATLQEAELLIEGIQRHWLIRRYIDKPAHSGTDRLPVSRIAGAGEGGE